MHPYIFACTHVFVCAYSCIYLHALMHLFVRTHSCIYYICSHAPMMHYYSHTFMYLFARTYAYIQTYSSCIYCFASAHAFIIYIFTCIHTYSHALMYLIVRTHAYIQTYSCIVCKHSCIYYIYYIYLHASIIHIRMHSCIVLRPLPNVFINYIYPHASMHALFACTHVLIIINKFRSIDIVIISSSNFVN